MSQKQPNQEKGTKNPRKKKGTKPTDEITIHHGSQTEVTASTQGSEDQKMNDNGGSEDQKMDDNGSQTDSSGEESQKATKDSQTQDAIPYNPTGDHPVVHLDHNVVCGITVNKFLKLKKRIIITKLSARQLINLRIFN